jgi:predicted O-methyltransferase YrrM/GNAT superfamily N-acetyltransferase
VRHYAHGARDPETGLGCQRESADDLGFGWIYFALARACAAERTLVIGSGRGFSAVCLALGMDRRSTGRVCLVDPGYDQWSVDGVTSDIAPGLWRDPDRTRRHFAEPLHVDNIRVLPLRSDEAFEQFRAKGKRFDLIVIDGDHGYRQSLRDLRQAVACLRAGGLILAHDAFTPRWPGVAYAIDTLVNEDPTLHRITIPLDPGLALIQRSQTSVTLRPITAHENERVNAWRADAGITARPLPLGDDPRPGERTADPRVGLFGIFADGQLIGGIGIRPRVFRAPGPDDFLPDGGRSLQGFLSYGLVIRPEDRGKGYMRLIRQQLLRWFAAEGYYVIGQYHSWSHQDYRQVVRVGENGRYIAYYHRLREVDGRRSVRCLDSFPWASRLEAHVRQLHVEPLQQCLQETTRELALARMRELELTQTLDACLRSTSWRWTYPARILGQWARLALRRARAFSRRPFPSR